MNMINNGGNEMAKTTAQRIRKTKSGFSIKGDNGYTFHADELDGGYEILHKLNGEQVGKVVHCYGTARAKELLIDRAEQYRSWVEMKLAERLLKRAV